ncbi:MAG: sigma-54-dependent Fis family transcriptional regulator [Rhodobacteraceae bacterium]|nr:sigma-54-dependent Fis family transcriptional regulator [Paracoccaceae bacterium]
MSRERHEDTVAAALSKGVAARSAIVASWSRSAELHGLAPEAVPRPERMTAAELAAARDRMGPLLHIAGPLLEQLFLAVGGVGCCVMLADANGVPVERRGAGADDATFASWGLWTGTCWSEAAQGTNGIGTALVEQRRVTIHRDQHFLSRNAALSCMSAPIWGAKGELGAILDVSSARRDLTPGFANLIAQFVEDTAHKIEAEAFAAAHPGARITILPGQRSRTALLAVNSDDLVIGATRAARQQLGLPAEITPRPAADLLGLAHSDRFEDGERATLQRALARAKGNASAAARSLGISRATFYRKLGRQAQDSNPDLSQD